MGLVLKFSVDKVFSSCYSKTVHGHIWNICRLNTNQNHETISHGEMFVGRFFCLDSYVFFVRTNIDVAGGEGDEVGVEVEGGII